MTILFQGNRTIPSGPNESSVLPVPQSIKQPGKSLEVKLRLGWAAFPAGVTAIDIFLSMDGGATFPRNAGGTWGPRPNDPKSPTEAVIGFSLGPNDNPTHAKYRTDASAQFTTLVIIEANSVA